MKNTNVKALRSLLLGMVVCTFTAAPAFVSPALAETCYRTIGATRAEAAPGSASDGSGLSVQYDTEFSRRLTLSFLDPETHEARKFTLPISFAPRQITQVQVAGARDFLVISTVSRSGKSAEAKTFVWDRTNSKLLDYDSSYRQQVISAAGDIVFAYDYVHDKYANNPWPVKMSAFDMRANRLLWSGYGSNNNVRSIVSARFVDPTGLELRYKLVDPQELSKTVIVDVQTQDLRQIRQGSD